MLDSAKGGETAPPLILPFSLYTKIQETNLKKMTKLYLYTNSKEYIHIKHNITFINFLIWDKLITNLNL